MTTATQDRVIDVAVLRIGNKPGNLAHQLTVPENLKVLNDPKEAPPAGCGCFRIMTPKDGDKRVVWDSRDFAQIHEAKSMFDELVAQGLVPYRVGVGGQPSSEVMVEFDPYAEEVVFLPIGLVAAG